MKTFSEILAILKSSQCWSWHRASGQHGRDSLSIYCDDLAGDRRRCYSVEIPNGKNREANVNLRVLRGFDPVKNHWAEYLPQEERNARIDSRRGEKALREYIAGLAVILRGVPNPPSLSYTDWSDGPKVAAHRESEAYLARIAARQ